MKDALFEFRVAGKLRIVVTGDNEGRYARYVSRIGEASDPKVSYFSNVAAEWKLDGKIVHAEDAPEKSFREVPVFYEARYKAHFFVEDKSVTDCTVEHVMASVSDEFEYVPERQGMDGTLDFVNVPGKFVFDIALWRGRAREPIRIEWWVVSEKIDVQRDAKLIIDRIEKAKNGFVYSFLTPTKNEGGLSEAYNSEDRIWYDVFKKFVSDYLAACRWVVNSPHLKYQNYAQHLRADRIRRWTPQQANRFAALPDMRKEKSLFRTEEIRPETDTVENRFVKHTLKVIARRLGDFAARCRGSAADGVSGVSKACIDLMEGWKTELDQLAARPFFRSIGRFTGFRQESLALQRKRGYSKIQETWLALQHAIDVMGKGLDVGNQPVWKLYEFWCFILMRDLLEAKGPDGFGLTYKSGDFGDIKTVDDVFADAETEKEPEDETEHPTKGGNICQFVFEDEATVPHRRVTLAYQQSYAGEKADGTLANIVEQIPDIVLTIANLDAEGGVSEEGSYTYLFDAKYRIYSLPSKKNPKYDAAPFVTLNDMHRYRDAILYRQQSDKTLSREIIGAYVLYPGRKEKSFDYGKVIKSENVGAIPLLPTAYKTDANGGRVRKADGTADFEGDDGEAALREFLRTVLARKTDSDHLGQDAEGNRRVISTRGTSVTVGEAFGKQAILDCNWIKLVKADARKLTEKGPVGTAACIPVVPVERMDGRSPSSIKFITIHAEESVPVALKIKGPDNDGNPMPNLTGLSVVKLGESTSGQYIGFQTN